MTENTRKGPTRYQAKVWSDTVLQAILRGVLFEFEGSRTHSHPITENAKQIGRYFPEFGAAFDNWMKHPNSSNAQMLKGEAEKVFLDLPVPYDHPDICYQMDAAEEEIVDLKQRIQALEASLENSEKARQLGWNEADRFRALLKESES